MKLFKRGICLIFPIILFSSFISINSFGGDYSLDYSSRYIWRGFDLNPNNKFVLQPSATFNLGKSGLTANVWGSFSFEDSELDELDLTLNYDINKFDNIDLSVGFIHYGWYFAKDFKFKDNTTQEIYLSAGFKKLPFNPNITVYYDFNNGDGLYATLGLSHSVNVTDNNTLDVSTTLGYNDGQWIDKSGFSDFTVSASMSFKYEKITISPFVSSVFILMDEVNPNVDNEILYGVSLSF